MNKAWHPVGESRSAEPAPRGPLLPQRTALIFIAGLLIGIATGTLTHLAGYPLAEAVLAGGAASGTAIPVLHKLIE